MKLVTSDLPPSRVLFFAASAAGLACGLLLVPLRDWRAISSGVHLARCCGRGGDDGATLCFVVALSRLAMRRCGRWIMQTAPLFLISKALTVLLQNASGRPRLPRHLRLRWRRSESPSPEPPESRPAGLLGLASAALDRGAGSDRARRVPARVPVIVMTSRTKTSS